MSGTLRVILEVGKKRRVVAGAMDWPGLDRWGTSEDDAVAKLLAYVPRYAGGRRARRPGDGVRARRATSTSSSASPDRARPTSGASPTSRREIEPRSARRTTWSAGWISCGPAGPSSMTSRRTPRPSSGPGLEAPAGRRDQIVRHVYVSEPEQMSRKVEVRTPREVVLTPDGLKDHRAAYLHAIRAYNAEGRPARTLADPVPRPTHRPPRHGPRLGDAGPGPHPRPRPQAGASGPGASGSGA